MSRIKTYVLAPNFQLRADRTAPEHPWLGNIIADPLNPCHRILDKLRALPPDTAIVPEVGNVYSTSRSHSLGTSVWAQALQTISAKVSGNLSQSTTIEYTMDGIDTLYCPIDDDEVTARIEANPRVQKVMRDGLFGNAPVYIISGIKVAKGFAWRYSHSTSIGATLEGSGPVAPPADVSVGASVDASRSRGREQGARIANGTDIVFAYQLHKVERKGFREQSRRLESVVHESKSAFLGEDGNDAASAEVEATEMTRSDFEAFDELEEQLDLYDFEDPTA